MIQVNDINKIKDSSLSKTKKTTSNGNFSAYLQDVMQTSVDAISGATPLSPADAIFAAQMVGEEEEKALRKKQVERGQTLLDKLEEIRNGLLRGYIAKEDLMEILFNPEVMPKRVNQADGEDLLLTSSCNYYAEGITQAEAEAFYADLKKKAKPKRPPMLGLNSRLERSADGSLFENVWQSILSRLCLK